MDKTKNTTDAPSDNIIVKGHKNDTSNNDDNNFKHHLGITAQKAIMELASESQSFRSNNNPWKVITVTK